MYKPDELRQEYTRLKADYEEKSAMALIEKSREKSFVFEVWYAKDNLATEAYLRLKRFEEENKEALFDSVEEC